MLITVATPTYNRAVLLPRLYKSLCKQTNKNFEWLVVDDGSTDDTEVVVANMIDEKRVDIRYIRKPNGGKHTAVNLAAIEARGELIFIADSDDWLTNDSLEAVAGVYREVRGDESFAGVCGLDVSAEGNIIGSGLPQSLIDATPIEIREKWQVRGDQKEVFRTEVLRQFPFPEISGERFCPEALVWNRIGAKYRLRYFDKPIYMVEYQPDGITSAITRVRMNCPISTMMTYSEWFDIAGTVKQKVKMALNYWRFRFCSRNNAVGISGWAKLLCVGGYVLHLKDLLEQRFLSADSLAFFGRKNKLNFR